MSSVERCAFVLVAACAFGAAAVSSAYASPLFVSHPPGLLLALARSNQFFASKLIAYECKAVKLLPPGDATVALRALSLLLVVDYERCTIGPLLVLHFHPVRYVIDANGLISLATDVLILGEGECVISWLASKNQSLGKVSFFNNPDGTVLLLASVKGVNSSGRGGPFPEKICEFPEQTDGVYSGRIRIEPRAGTIRWEP